MKAQNNSKAAIRLPRKLKKGLKRVMKGRFASWLTKDFCIKEISRASRYKNSENSLVFKGWAVISFTIGYNK